MAEGFRRAYVLRLWREHAATPLRATLVPAAQPHERHHFDTVGAGLVFLQEHACTMEPIDSNTAWE